MAALLSSIISPLDTDSHPRKPPSHPSSSSPTQPINPPQKSFKKMFRASLQETLRTATRSKSKSKDTSLDGSARQLSLKQAIELPIPLAPKGKEKEARASIEREADKSKAKELDGRRSTDASNTTTATDPAAPKGLRRLSSKTTFGKRKSNDPSTSSSPQSDATRRSPKSNGWPAFMTPSISQASISSPALHLSSDPNSRDTPTTQISPATSIGALISPPRTKRVSLTQSTSPTKKSPLANSSSTRPVPSPLTFTLSSSKGYPRHVASQSTTALPESSQRPSPSTPTRGIIRNSGDLNRDRSASQSRSRERSPSRSPSPTTVRRQRVGPIPIPSTPTPVRRTSESLSWESNPKASGPSTSPSGTYLPLGGGGNPPISPIHIRRNSRERNAPSTPPPAFSSGSHSIYQQRRNSSSLSVRTSSPNNGRALSPAHQKRGASGSTTSLISPTPLSPQREALRQAATFVIKQMARPIALAVKANNADTIPDPLINLAPSRVPVNPWDEIEYRLLSLMRMERMWAKSSILNSRPMTRDQASGSTGSEGGSGFVVGTVSAGGGGEKREREAFSDALRDGYVLCQLLNKLGSGSSLPIPRVDPREDGYLKTSNVLKFRDAVREFIAKHSEKETRDVVIFMRDDLSEGTPESIGRVVDTILLLARTHEARSSTQRWGKTPKETDKDSNQTKRKSVEVDQDVRRASISHTTFKYPYNSISRSAAASTPNLVTKTHSPPVKKSSKRWSPPSPTLQTIESGNAISQAAEDDQPSSGSGRSLRHSTTSIATHRQTTASKAALSTSPHKPANSPPPLPPRRMSLETRVFNTNPQPASPPPAPPPPRSTLRPPVIIPNRASLASSRQSQATDHTALFETSSNANRMSNRFGTMRTINTINTEATSIHADSNWDMEDGNDVDIDFEEGFDQAPMSPSSWKRPPEFKGFPHHSANDLFLENGSSIPARPLRRDRRSSEVAVDLGRVQEEATDMEGSVIKKHPRHPSDETVPQSEASVVTSTPSPIKLGKGKWPDDYMHLLNPSSPPPILTQPSTPLIPKRSASTRRANELSPTSPAPLLSVHAALDLERTPQADKTPRGKAQLSGSGSSSAAESLRRRQLRLSLGDIGEPFVASPMELSASFSASTDDSLSKAGLGQFRRPTHRAGSQSVDVLLPQVRRSSFDRPLRRLQPRPKTPSDDSSSLDSGGSGNAIISPLAGPAPRPMARRSSSRSTNTARHGVYIANPPNFETRSSSPMTATISVPALPSTRVPFPRASSGEYSHLESSQVNLNDSSDTLQTGGVPIPAPRTNGLGLLHAPISPTRQLAVRPRHQSDFDSPRLARRRSSTRSVAQPGQQRTNSISGEDGSRFSNLVDPSALNRRSRIESTPMAATNLTRASSVVSGMNGSAVRQTLAVKEEGKAPTHYQLGNCIGRGQFGSVYRALNLNTGQMVAVKRIRLEGLPETEVTQLMKEVDLLKKLSHPSIVKYEGMVRDTDALSIVLEYVENGSLGQTLKAFGKLNESLVATYVTKILEGLHYLHEQKVVHCDLKAANILTTKNGNIKLSDFGVSLNLHAMENISENVQGTPNWMAPEVIKLQGASTASDIWSLGCTVVELLTGKPPFVELGNPMSVMFHIAESSEPPIPEGVSYQLNDFLLRCFEKNPVDRPSAENLFEHPWLKQKWGEHKELRPQDSIPFLRRVSTDLHKSDLARQLSIMEFNEGVARRQSDVSPSNLPPVEPEFVTRPHSFVKTTFSKPVVCRVCHQYIKKSAVLCDECSLICHSKCAVDAPPTCDVRAQLLAYAQYANNSRDSPRLSSSVPLPSPLLHNHAAAEGSGLTSSPSFPKLFPWKRNHKSSLAADASTSGTADDTSQSRSRPRLLSMKSKASQDRSRSRGSVNGSSQNSSGTGSDRTINSRASLSGVTATTGDTIRADATRQPRSTAARPDSTVSQGTSNAGPEPASSPPSDAGRRRKRRDSGSTSKSDCVIQ